jgi:hypothetical protein
MKPSRPRRGTSLERYDAACAQAAAEMWRKGKTVSVIRRHFRVRGDRVTEWLHQHGIDTRSARGQETFDWWAALDWRLTSPVIARGTGKSESSVKWWRGHLKKLGLARDAERRPVRPNQKRRKLADYIAAGLGTFSDAEVARTLGIAVRSVTQQRLRYLFPSATASADDPKAVQRALERLPSLRSTVFKNTQAYRDAGIGQRSDQEVAQALDVTPERVGQVRRKLGLAVPPSRDKTGCAEEAATMWRQGTPVRQLARHFQVRGVQIIEWLEQQGIHPQEDRSQAIFDGWASLDWSQSTAALVEQTGMSPEAVTRWRRKLKQHGLATDVAPQPARTPWGFTLDDYLREGLGKDPDRVVAERLNVSVWSVKAYRQNHDIPSARSRRAKSR